MSSLPGGAASKLGDRYEDWWTLYRIADVLRGTASSIRLEPLGSEGAGIEFWVQEPDTRWYEQVKDAPARGSWSLVRLRSEGVTSYLGSHLAAGHSVRFVAATPARDLQNLSNRARAAVNLTEYRGVLTAVEKPGFEALAAAWGTDELTAYDYLRRVQVEHHPAETLRRLVYHSYERLVRGEPEQVVDALRGWLDDVLHEVLTGPMIWDRIRRIGFTRLLLLGDPTTTEGLAASVERHARHVAAIAPAIGLAEHPYVDQLVARLCEPNGHQIVLVDGRAGSGKSTVAAGALRRLAADGWFAAAVRMDSTRSEVQSAAALGNMFDLDGSPAVLLDGVAAGGSAVLLIDQLDAVSLYSGRMPGSYDSVAEIIEQSAAMPALKIVLVVRTADLTADSRMRALVADTARVVRLTIGDLGSDAVRSVLNRASMGLTEVTDDTLDLLRTPLHLAVFARLSPERRTIPYRTRPELFKELTSQVRTTIERHLGMLDWGGITGALIDRMSDAQQLDAPSGLLDNWPTTAIASLVSHGILLNDDDRISFFHETYFDYLFAQAFVASGRDLHEFLVSSGQHLFRRAQARQVLEHLATSDRAKFREGVAAILASSSVRRHLQDVAITVLRHLDADVGDWLTIEPLAFAHSEIARPLQGLLSSEQWFDALDRANRWPGLLANQATADAAGSQLVFAARQRPRRVAELVQPHIGSSDAWRSRLQAIVQWSLRPELVDLAVTLLDRGDLDGAQGPIGVNSDFWSLLYHLHPTHTVEAARLIGAYLCRGLARAEADGESDPFESGYLSAHSVGAASIIGEVAQVEPTAFIAAVLPFVQRVAVASARTDDPAQLRSTIRWHYRWAGVSHDVDEAVFSGLETALILVAARTRDLDDRIWALAYSDVYELRFLACRALAAGGQGNDAVDWLTSDTRNLSLGWADSPRWASRELVTSASQHCSDGHLDQLFSCLLAYYPAWERTRSGRRSFGHAQYELLSAINPTRRSDSVRRRLDEWERKFQHAPPREPQAIEVGVVGPPIPETATELMTDADWLRAIDRYIEREWTGPHLVGGAVELARVLGSRAKAEPDRFARLALRLPAGTTTVYFERVIDAVAGEISPALLTDLCQHARTVAGQHVGRSVCGAVATVARDATEALVDLVEECARDDDPAEELAMTPASAPGEFYYGGDLLTAGINSTRGGAANAMSRLLFANEIWADRLIPTVGTLVTDRILAVRAVAADALVALLNHRPDQAIGHAKTMFDSAPIELFGTATVSRLLTYAILRDPEAFAAHLLRCLAGPEAVAERAGLTWAVAFSRDALCAPLPTDVAELPTSARRGAAAGFASDPALAITQAPALLNDADAAVRKAAAAAVRVIDRIEPATADAFIRVFTSSAAYADGFAPLLYHLDQWPGMLPASALSAAEQAIDIAGAQLGDIRTRYAATSPQLINVTLRLYRQGDAGVRERCLDIIDHLAALGAYGLDQALAESER